MMKATGIALVLVAALSADAWVINVPVTEGEDIDAPYYLYGNITWEGPESYPLDQVRAAAACGPPRRVLPHAPSWRSGRASLELAFQPLRNH